MLTAAAVETASAQGGRRWRYRNIAREAPERIIESGCGWDLASGFVGDFRIQVCNPPRPAGPMWNALMLIADGPAGRGREQ